MEDVMIPWDRMNGNRKEYNQAHRGNLIQPSAHYPDTCGAWEQEPQRGVNIDHQAPQQGTRADIKVQYAAEAAAEQRALNKSVPSMTFMGTAAAKSMQACKG